MDWECKWNKINVLYGLRMGELVGKKNVNMFYIDWEWVS
jgi:hypothetical protein